MGIQFNPLTSNFDLIGPIPGPAPVTSVNGQVGAVNLTAADIPYDNSGSGLSATEVQAAIDELAPHIITGTPDRFAIYNSTGTLTSTTDNGATFTASTGATSIGQQFSGSVFTATGAGAVAFGSTTSATDTIRASGDGSLVSGSAADGGVLEATTTGAVVHGFVDGAAATLTAEAQGAMAIGFSTNAIIKANGSGAFAHGTTNGGNIIATGQGSVANGLANDSTIEAVGDGSVAHGSAITSGNIIHATAAGSRASGFISGPGSTINATENGSIANGSIDHGASTSSITSSGRGAIASGVVSADNSSITAAAKGSFALGFVDGNDSSINSSGFASVAIGYINGTTSILNNGSATSLVLGELTNNDNINVNGSTNLVIGNLNGGNNIDVSTNASLIISEMSGTGTLTTDGSSSIIAVRAANAGNTVTGGIGTIVVGTDAVGILTVGGTGTAVFGSAHTVNNDYCLVQGVGQTSSNANQALFGTYADTTDTTTGFVVGNGSVGSPSNVLSTTNVGATRIHGNLRVNSNIVPISTTIDENHTNIVIQESNASIKTTTLPATPFDGETHTVVALYSNTKTSILSGNGHNINGAATLSMTPGETISVVYDIATTQWIITNTSSSSKYTASFNDTSDWTSASPDYTFTVTGAIHGKGVFPTVQVFQSAGGINSLVNVTTEVTAASGDVVIKVSLSPDNRFTGVIVIS